MERLVEFVETTDLADDSLCRLIFRVVFGMQFTDTHPFPAGTPRIDVPGRTKENVAATPWRLCDTCNDTVIAFNDFRKIHDPTYPHHKPHLDVMMGLLDIIDGIGCSSTVSTPTTQFHVDDIPAYQLVHLYNHSTKSLSDPAEYLIMRYEDPNQDTEMKWGGKVVEACFKRGGILLKVHVFDENGALTDPPRYINSMSDKFHHVNGEKKLN